MKQGVLKSQTHPETLSFGLTVNDFPQQQDIVAFDLHGGSRRQRAVHEKLDAPARQVHNLGRKAGQAALKQSNVYLRVRRKARLGA